MANIISYNNIIQIQIYLINMTSYLLKGIKNNMDKNNALPLKYIKQMIVREKTDTTKNMHPALKKRMNQTTQEPLPLKFKLHSMETIRA